MGPRKSLAALPKSNSTDKLEAYPTPTVGPPIGIPLCRCQPTNPRPGGGESAGMEFLLVTISCLSKETHGVLENDRAVGPIACP